MTVDRGAGDIISTVQDLNTFHKALREGRIISQASLRQMENFLSPGEYGLGYYRQRNDGLNITLVGHAGGYPGSGTTWWYWVEKDTYIAGNVNGDLTTDILNPIVAYLYQKL